MVIIQQLRKQLPRGYVAEPRAHLGQPVEVDVTTYERDDAPRLHGSPGETGGGVATAPWIGTEPVLAVETELADEYEYAVRVYDVERGRQLVAAVEIVSPGNKDRPEKRNAFVGKCAAMLQKGVAVSIVDLVTVRHFNLYAELMAFIGHRDPTMSADPPAVYAASVRWAPWGDKNYLQAWSYPLVVGRPLPTLPLWLTAERRVPLDLESSYEQTCHDLWIT